MAQETASERRDEGVDSGRMRKDEEKEEGKEEEKQEKESGGAVVIKMEVDTDNNDRRWRGSSLLSVKLSGGVKASFSHDHNASHKATREAGSNNMMGMDETRSRRDRHCHIVSRQNRSDRPPLFLFFFFPPRRCLIFSA